MPTTSTIPAFKRKLVELLGDALPGTQVAYRWPGPSTEDRGVYLRDVFANVEPAGLVDQATRAPRRERYEVELVCTSWRDGLDPVDGPADAEEVVFDLLAAVEGVIAGTSRDALKEATGAASWTLLGSYTPELEPFEGGWRAQIVARVQVTAHLT